MPTASTSKGLRITSWVLQVVIAAALLFIGAIPKLTGQFPSPQLFEKIGEWAEPGFRYFVGVWELAAAILIVIPKTVQWGALLVALAMVGAFGAHVATPLGFMPEFTSPQDPEETVALPGFFSLIFLALGLAVLFLRRDMLPIGGKKPESPAGAPPAP